MSSAPPERVVSGEAALAAFRRDLTGPALIDHLDRAGGRLLVRLPVGVGKSVALAAAAAHARCVARPDALVVVLAPRRDILDELRRRLRTHAPVVLDPRPQARCGASNAAWRVLETRGCSLLGRETLCARCPVRTGCRWPDRQAGELDGARLVLATQQHLLLDPAFVRRLAARTGAPRTLLLVDESDLVLKPFGQELSADALDRFRDAAGAVPPTPAGQRWLDFVALAIAAPTGDLQAGRWAAPPVGRAWALAVQHAGRCRHGDAFYFLAHDLAAFARSDPAGRERTPGGGLRFAALPDLGREWVVFSGSVAPGLVRHRVDPNRAAPPPGDPFAGVRVEHPGTKWYNLATALGAAKFFPKNAPQILDFFARLVARNVLAGRRTLLVARKQFVPVVARELRRRVAALAGGRVRIATGNWDRQNLADPRTVPLVSYGISGVNRFEDFDAAYCVTSFYVPARVVEGLVNDLEPSPVHAPVRIEMSGVPPRRTAVVPGSFTGTVVPTLAAAAFAQKEADVVVQAVGRVRPFTRPREVLTFQLGALPGVRFDREFTTLAAARDWFGLPTPCGADRAKRLEAVARMVAGKKTRAEMMAELDLSESTVKRLVRRVGGVNDPLHINKRPDDPPEEGAR